VSLSAILENTPKGYLGQFLINLHQIWCADRCGQCKGDREWKTALLKNQDGGGRHLGKDKKWYVLVNTGFYFLKSCEIL